MEIKILEFADGAGRANGVTVIIDVFRAFSVACYAFDAGASRVITTAEVDDAFKLSGKYVNSVLAGERNERKIEGFNFGNSPTEIIKSDLSGKIFIQTTTAGTRGLANAVNADVLLTGSFVNAASVATYIKSLNPEVVSLVAMGYRGNISAEEDLLCAEMIANMLRDINLDLTERIADLRNTSGKRFFLPANIEFSPPSDFFLCTMTDRFNFALKAVPRPDGNHELYRIDVS